MSNLIPHKHAEVIKAWADGATIEYQYPGNSNWYRIQAPTWSLTTQYRVAKTTIKYRLYLWTPSFGYHNRPTIVAVVTDKENDEDPRSKWVGFVQWVGDWQVVSLP